MNKFGLLLSNGKVIECKTERTLDNLAKEIKKMNLVNVKLVSYNGAQVRETAKPIVTDKDYKRFTNALRFEIARLNCEKATMEKEFEIGESVYEFYDLCCDIAHYKSVLTYFSKTEMWIDFDSLADLREYTKSLEKLVKQMREHQDFLFKDGKLVGTTEDAWNQFESAIYDVSDRLIYFDAFSEFLHMGEIM